MRLYEWVQYTRLVVHSSLDAVLCSWRLNATPPQPPRELDLSELEDRVLLSAVPAAMVMESPDVAPPNLAEEALQVGTLEAGSTAAQVSTSWDGTEIGEAAVQQLDRVDALLAGSEELAVRRELVFVDPSVEDTDQLLEELWSHNDPHRELDVVLLDPNRDGVEQISEVLSQREQLDAVHLVSLGSEGSLKLGATWLTGDALSGSAGQIALWQDALATDARITIHGYDVSANDDGGLLESLSALTGAEVVLDVPITHDPLELVQPVLAQPEPLNDDLSFSFDTQQPFLELVVVDESVADYEQLVADLSTDRDDGRSFEVIVLDSHRDGIEQTSEILAGYETLDAVHIVSHGTSGAVKLGDTWLRSDNVTVYAGQIAGWGDALADEADLLFYSCDLAGNEQGQTLVESLSALTSADVAASTDNTGYALLGGDWVLEFRSGEVETTIAFTTDVQQIWTHLLNTAPTIATPGPAVNYTENDPATIIDATATVSDPDSPDFGGGQLTVSFSAGGTTNDVLGIVEGGNVTLNGSNIHVNGFNRGTFSGGTGGTDLVISWGAQGTPADAQAVLRQIAYRNTSDSPNTTQRTIDFILTDGDGGTSNTAQQTVNVTSVNDPPVVDTNSELTILQGATGLISNSLLLISDADNTTAEITYTLTVAPTKRHAQAQRHGAGRHRHFHPGRHRRRPAHLRARRRRTPTPTASPSPSPTASAAPWAPPRSTSPSAPMAPATMLPS